MYARRVVMVIALLVLIGLGLYIASTRNADVAQENEYSTTSSPMRVEENAIVIGEQAPGMVVTVSDVYLSRSGFIVIHEDDNGTAGAVIGTSALLPSGETKDIAVPLTRVLRDGERLHAMLHADTNGDGSFDIAADSPIQGSVGAPIEGLFDVSSTTATTTGGAISI